MAHAITTGHRDIDTRLRFGRQTAVGIDNNRLISVSLAIAFTLVPPFFSPLFNFGFDTERPVTHPKLGCNTITTNTAT
jgi:hypothetical protein